MNTDYKPNSHKSKAEEKERESTLPEKKVEKIISGTAKVKKKNGARKIADVFISEDAANVKSYVLMDVVVPAVKDVLANIVKDSIDMILFGGTKRGGNKRPNGLNSSYVSYNRYSDRDDRRYDSRASISSRYDFDNIVIDNKGEAEEVLDRMSELLDTYGMVTVADLCDLVGVSCDYTDNKYGWTHLRNARTVRVRDGYILDLPRVTLLK